MARLLRIHEHAVGANWARNILDLLLAEGLVAKVRLAFEVIKGGS